MVVLVKVYTAAKHPKHQVVYLLTTHGVFGNNLTALCRQRGLSADVYARRDIGATEGGKAAAVCKACDI